MPPPPHGERRRGIGPATGGLLAVGVTSELSRTEGASVKGCEAAGFGDPALQRRNGRRARSTSLRVDTGTPALPDSVVGHQDDGVVGHCELGDALRDRSVPDDFVAEVCAELPDLAGSVCQQA